MGSEKEQKNFGNPFLNPMDSWQRYLLNLIHASKGFYENAMKSNEYWLKAFWDPWLRVVTSTRQRNKEGRIKTNICNGLDH
jgi:hypothetical protein